MKIALILGLLLLSVMLAGCQDNSLGQAASLSRVYVLTTPAGAQVSINGVACGQSPVTCIVQVSTTPLTLIATKVGFAGYRTTVTVYAGRTSYVSATLTETPVCGDGYRASTEYCDPLSKQLQCPQAISLCEVGTHKYGARSSPYGICNSQCQCVLGPVSWSCVIGQCLATAASQANCVSPAVFSPNTCQCCTSGNHCKDDTHWGLEDKDCGWTNVQTCNGGCHNDICVSFVCTDTDGGDYKLVPGIVTSKMYVNGVFSKTVSATDTCSDKETITEAVCGATSLPGFNQVQETCANGFVCDNGPNGAAACIPSSGCTAGWKCKDGSTYGYQDVTCAWTQTRICSAACNSEVCHDCTDLDGGFNVNKPSTATYYKFDSRGPNNAFVKGYSDTCLGPGTLREYACSPSNQGTAIMPPAIVYRDYECVSGCANGMCSTPEPPIAPPPSS